VAKVFRECLCIIWLVTDTFILLTVHGVISLSFICFPLNPYSITGKTVVYSSLPFVLVETSKSFLIFVKSAIAVLLKLILFFFVSSLVQPILVMRSTKNLQLVTVLISSPSEKVFTFPTVLITVVFCRFKFRPTLSLLFFYSFYQFDHVIPSFHLVQWYHLRMLGCLFSLSPFRYLLPYHLLLPFFIMFLLYRLNRSGDKIQPCRTPFWIGNRSVVL